jgi:hypothetical protein
LAVASPGADSAALQTLCNHLQVTTRPAAHRSVWPLVAIGLALGAICMALLALLVVALSLWVNGTLLVIIGVGLGDARLVWLPFVGLLAVFAVALGLRWLLTRQLLPALRAWRPLGAAGWSAVVIGAATSAALGLWLAPAEITSTARHFVTGETAQQRAARPAVQARQQRLQAILHAAPGGPEAVLLAAVDRVAAPVPSPGRLLDGNDVKTRVAALRGLQPTLPPEWQPVLIGTLAQVQQQHYGPHPEDDARREALAEAGRAGSRALTLLAAENEEGIADYLERRGARQLADKAWQRALEGYAAAGAAFEVARLSDETLPERLGAIQAPPTAQFPGLDAAFSEKLWVFAQALGDDAAYPHASPGQRDLALMSALIALERAPDAPQVALRNPAQRWGTGPWAMGRWVLALRHARGDCLAALGLSNATRQRRRPAVVNRSQPSASALDLAWAVAWMEAGEACARSDEELRQAREHRATLDYIRFAPGELEAARAGVSATIEVLR